MKLDVASRTLSYGLVGTLAGYALAPLVGALVGSVPRVLIDPRYFVRPFMGCIAPFPLFLAYMTSFCGIFLGVLAGGFIGFRSSLPR